jgi:hypothetical protein
MPRSVALLIRPTRTSFLKGRKTTSRNSTVRAKSSAFAPDVTDIILLRILWVYAIHPHYTVRTSISDIEHNTHH